MSDILSRLDQKYFRLPEHPAGLYLGSTDWFEFMRAVKTQPSVFDETKVGRARYRGVPIYLVNAESHLHFSSS